jgi:hypothetical protein
MLKPDYTVMLVGARGSGKTIMMLYLLKILARQVDMAVAFVPTTDTQEEFERHIQKCFVYPDYDEKELDRIVNAQRSLKQRKPKKMPDGSLQTPNHRRIAIVLDDCMYNKKSGKGNTLRYLFMNGRHDHFFFMNAVQYVMDMDKSLRSQIDLVVAFPVSEESMIKPLRENLLGCFSTDAQLQRMFKEGLRENEALVFDRRRANKKQTSLFYCKAEFPLPRFRVGCDLFWMWYYKHFVRRSAAHIDALINSRLQAALDKPKSSDPAKSAPIQRISRKKKASSPPPPHMASLPFD